MLDTNELLRRASAEQRALCGAHRASWHRWRTGTVRVPRAVESLLRILVCGELPQGGADWAGWQFHKGRLYDATGQWHTPGTIMAWHWVRQMLETARAEENRAERAGENVLIFSGRRSARSVTAELYRRLGD